MKVVRNVRFVHVIMLLVEKYFKEVKTSYHKNCTRFITENSPLGKSLD
jgi:hypothetical protein